MKITKEEILKLGKIAKIDISEEEVPVLRERIEGLLTYVSCLKELIKEPTAASLPHAVNVTRADVVKPTDPTSLLTLAPQAESNYFVVPMVLKAD